MKISGLWLITPVYQDVESFLRLRERTLEIISSHLILRLTPLRFVAVDDTGGFDPEMQRLRALRDVTVVEPPFNLGHQRAIVYGIRTMTPEIADTDVVVTLDSDGEDRPEDLPRLLAPILEEPADLRRVVLALRTGRRETPVFKAMYLSFKVLFRLLTGLSVRTGNYAAYRGWFARHAILHPYFDLCYSSTLVSLNLPVTYVPCERGTVRGPVADELPETLHARPADAHALGGPDRHQGAIRLLPHVLRWDDAVHCCACRPPVHKSRHPGV